MTRAKRAPPITVRHTRRYTPHVPTVQAHANDDQAPLLLFGKNGRAFDESSHDARVQKLKEAVDRLKLAVQDVRAAVGSLARGEMKAFARRHPMAEKLALRARGA